MLKLARRIGKVVRVRLRGESASLGLLDEVLVSLLFGEPDGIILRVEEYPGPLHHIARGLPANEWILPTMALGQYIPVHTPVVTLPFSGLRCGLGLLVDPVRDRISTASNTPRISTACPYLTCRACNSTGAPEMTAAGRVSVSSLAFWTRFGTGVKVLDNSQYSLFARSRLHNVSRTMSPYPARRCSPAGFAAEPGRRVVTG